MEINFLELFKKLEKAIPTEAQTARQSFKRARKAIKFHAPKEDLLTNLMYWMLIFESAYDIIFQSANQIKEVTETNENKH